MLTTDKVLKRRPCFQWMLQIRYHFIHRIARDGVGLKINVDGKGPLYRRCRLKTKLMKMLFDIV